MSVAYELFPATDSATDPATDPAADPAGATPVRLAPRLFLVPPVADPSTRGPRSAPPSEVAGVAVLLPPVDTPPVRLTRRGVVVVAVATAVVAVALVVLATLSARAAGSNATSAAAAGRGPAAVTVRPGDTLWSIASANAAGSDPRAEVAVLQRLNHLSGASLVPGQRLRLR